MSKKKEKESKLVNQHKRMAEGEKITGMKKGGKADCDMKKGGKVGHKETKKKK